MKKVLEDKLLLLVSFSVSSPTVTHPAVCVVTEKEIIDIGALCD